MTVGVETAPAARPAGRVEISDRARAERRLGLLLSAPAVLVMLLVTGYPLFNAVCLSEIWKTTPFISLLLLAGLAQVPRDLGEAAVVDGATAWQRLRRVTIPNM